jgi:hypothetical protein
MKTDLNTSITSTKTSRSFKNTSIPTFHGKFEHANGDFSGNLKCLNQPTGSFSGNSDHDNQWAGNSERSLKPASSLVKTGLVIGDHSKDIYSSKKSEVETGVSDLFFVRQLQGVPKNRHLIIFWRKFFFKMT